MSDFAERRRIMVDTQVRPSDVTKFPIIDAMLSVPREVYVPNGMREAAYVGENLEVAPGRVALEPRTLAKMLDALDIGSAHVVGASVGGMIAQEMAISHPDKVSSVCSIMSNTGDRKNGGISGRLVATIGRSVVPTRETAVEHAVKLFGLISGPHYDPELCRSQATWQVERSFTPAGVARQTAAIAASRDRTELLRSVTAPTLVIHGLTDPLVKPSGGVATATAVPGSRLLNFPDMGHDLPRPRWHEIRNAIVDNTRRDEIPNPIGHRTHSPTA